MKRIITTDEAVELGNALQKENKRTVVGGGCFDILHIGHLGYLKNAKAQGEVLVILLESDESITASKGPHRPINNQQDRAEMLAAFTAVDYVILLPTGMTNEAYDTLIFAIKPAIIATTKGDQYRSHKERQAMAIGAQVVDVIEPVENQSTTKIVNILNEL